MHQLTPAQSLCWALIEDAVATLRRRGATPARDKGEHASSLEAETRAWIASDEDQWIFSFVRCCLALRIDPRRVRAMIARGEARGDWYVTVRPRSTRNMRIETDTERAQRKYAAYYAKPRKRRRKGRVA